MNNREEKTVHNQRAWSAGRIETVLALAMVFMAGAVGSLLLTVGGVHWLIQQVDLADSLKSSIITLVLGLGLVFVGPVLLWALTTVLPRWWFRRVKEFFVSIGRKCRG